MRKRIFAYFLCFAMLLSLCGCAQSENANTSAPTEVTAPDPNEQEWLPYDESGANKLTDRDAVGENGSVSSTSWYASKAGLDVLKAGGNAVDAAIAVAYALGVVEPYTSGIGGGGFMTVYDAATGEVNTVDFRETAPAASKPDMWGELDENGKAAFFTLPDGTQVTGAYGRVTTMGGLSVGVPGEVKGLEWAYENYGSGKLTMAQLLQSAIDYAENGYKVTPTMVSSTNDEYNEISCMEELAGYYLDEFGLPPETGTVIKNPDLAKTLKMIAEKGSDAFYTGEIAQAMVDTVQKYSGIMTMEDLAKYTYEVREPVSSTYRDYQVYSLAPASSGGTHVIEILNILENYDLASMEVNSPEYIHLLSEAMKIAFADREQYMADPAFAEVPTATLTSKDYAAKRASRIVEGNGSYGAGEINEHGSTTSFAVVDKDGNMVNCTVTIGNFYGSKIAVDGYGFILNDEMYDFSTDVNSVNCAEGGKRPLSSISSTVVLDPDGKAFLTIGTPGGDRIFSAVAQVIQRMIDYGMDVQEAIDTVRVFSRDEQTLYCEESGVNPISEETFAALEKMGYTVSKNHAYDLFFGGVQGIAVQKDGKLHGGADPRRSGKALAY